MLVSITRFFEIACPLIEQRQRHECRCIVGVFRKLGLQLAERLWKVIGRKISLDQQIVCAGKIWVELERFFKLCLR